ncbi:MAG: carbohydrate ABC transporter permease [Betaproteobacteria bacterium]|jgi:ABC-type glycerol-3-phosphate transport system permease component|nr:carbohydrate ABC transporter permease [Betaproteobacteria bacterium]NBT68574.1 carbohydrate ABC transporter permease [Betaproteobacteria bacterium]NBY07340.1 carbohydrate ABC transporter permease [Betaproteobacteria bacterium]
MTSTSIPIPGYQPTLENRLWTFVQQALILLLISSIILPIFWMTITAFKWPRDVYSLNSAIWFEPTLTNMVTVFQHPWNLGNKILNSIAVASGAVALAIPMATLAAYAFSRYEFRLKKTIFLTVIASQFLPGAVVVLPYFLMFKKLGLLDTRTALILINLSIVLPYAIWMIKGFIDAVPIEIEESALVDGAPRWRVLAEIVVPAAIPGIITAAIFSFTLTWNEFLFALILSKQDALTLPIGLIGFRTDRGDLWELMAAGGILITTPMFILSLLVHRQFIGSLTAGSVR